MARHLGLLTVEQGRTTAKAIAPMLAFAKMQEPGDPENDRPPEGNPHNLPHYNQSKELRGRPEIPVDWSKIPTIGEVMVGQANGRTDPSQITYFCSVGDGMGFVAVGSKLLKAAKEKGIGRELPLDLWQSQVDDWATLT